MIQHSPRSISEGDYEKRLKIKPAENLPLTTESSSDEKMVEKEGACGAELGNSTDKLGKSVSSDKEPPPGMEASQIWCNPSHPTISERLGSLSREQRELVWVDLSGNRKGCRFYQEVPEYLQETPYNVQKSMAELDEAISKLPTFTLLRKVQQASPCYVNHPRFRLQFLRCERFDVPSQPTSPT